MLWPNAAIKSRDLAVAPPLNGRKQIGAELVPTFILEKEHSGKVMKLRGHKFAIHTLLYAPDNDVIIGSGFDFDVSILIVEGWIVCVFSECLAFSV